MQIGVVNLLNIRMDKLQITFVHRWTGEHYFSYVRIVFYEPIYIKIYIDCIKIVYIQKVGIRT